MGSREPAPVEVTGGSNEALAAPMTPAGQAVCDSVATVIRDAAPFALCPGCIASKLSMPEERVRAAMQFLVSITSEFAVRHRMCSGCGTTTRLIALRD